MARVVAAASLRRSSSSSSSSSSDRCTRRRSNRVVPRYLLMEPGASCHHFLLWCATTHLRVGLLGFALDHIRDQFPGGVQHGVQSTAEAASCRRRRPPPPASEPPQNPRTPRKKSTQDRLSRRYRTFLAKGSYRVRTVRGFEFPVDVVQHLPRCAGRQRSVGVLQFRVEDVVNAAVSSRMSRKERRKAEWASPRVDVRSEKKSNSRPLLRQVHVRRFHKRTTHPHFLGRVGARLCRTSVVSERSIFGTVFSTVPRRGESVRVGTTGRRS